MGPLVLFHSAAFFSGWFRSVEEITKTHKEKYLKVGDAWWPREFLADDQMSPLLPGSVDGIKIDGESFLPVFAEGKLVGTIWKEAVKQLP